MTTIDEDDVNNPGNTVAQIIASAGGDRITDVDASASEGIALFNAASGNGSWEYSIDGGSNWTDAGGLVTVGGAQAAIAIQLVVVALGLTSLMAIMAQWFDWLRWIGAARDMAAASA